MGRLARAAKLARWLCIHWMIMSSKASRQALCVVLIYVIAAGVWVLFSDRLVNWLSADQDLRARLSIFKGWVFVLATGGLLYLVLWRQLQVWEQAVGERKKIGIELEKARTYYRNLLATSSDGIHLLRANGELLEANPAFYQMLGYPPENPPALKVTDWNYLWPEAELLRRIRNLIESPSLFETVHRRRDGRDINVEINARGIEVNGEHCLFASAREITNRKQVEGKLRESEAHYRQLFELESDAVFLADAGTQQILDVNQSAQQLYGYTREEFLCLRLADVADAGESVGEVSARRAGGPDRWHCRKNGEHFAVEMTTSTFEHHGRRMQLSAVRDITARQQAIDQLRETTAQLLEAQQVAGLGSYVFDVTTGLWTGSNILGDILGVANPHTPRPIEAWEQVVHPRDREEMHRYFQEEVLKKRMPFDRIYRIVRAGDQQERWVHGLGKLMQDDHGRVTRLVGVIQDITQRQRAEEQMNVQLSALSAAANAIVITDCEGKIKWVNPAFSRLTGYSADEAIGHTPRVLNSHQHPPAFFANLWSTILAGHVWHGEIINRRKDEQLYTEDMTITPVRGADGRIRNFVAIKQDVTEQRQLERRIQQAQKLEAIGTLAGGIAHDFNNILASMFGYVYLLQQDTRGNAGAQESIDEILKATARAKDLVQQILTFSRQHEQKPQVIQLESVLKEVVKFLRASLPAQIKIELRVAPDAPPVLADPTQIYQVAINLATNALHAMEGRSGQLTVSVEPFLPDARYIQLHPEFRPVPYALLVLADTGHGMEAKTLERIFEPFFTTKPIGKGTGLGLSVVHGIVQSHHGVITVESELGRGTTFKVYFPGQSADAAPALAAADAEPAGRGERLLLLDDEPALTGALRRLLTRLNYQVTVSNSVREALDWCAQDASQFDLVITDLTMPEMTGLEVARRLHTLRPDLPVILTSGFCADLSRETMAAAGIVELLEKPVTRQGLAEALRRVLDRPPPAGAPPPV